MAESGVTGHLVQILDPAEETLAYEGRMEFRSPEGSERWVADRVETLRPEYQRKLAVHRAKIEEATRRIGWSFLVHHTDRPAAEPLLTLIMRLQGMAGDYRWKPRCGRRGRRAMTLGPIAFLSPWLLAGLLALPVIWWLLRTIPPRPRRLEFPPTRILVGIENREKTPAQTPWWLTLIRMRRPRSSSWRWPSPCSIPTARRRCRAPGRWCWSSTTAGPARRSGARAHS